MDRLSAMKAFMRVVQTGSFSATGRELNTTQTTISKRIAALESELGVQLLIRSSRDHTLTSAGALFFEKCQQILADLDEAETAVRSDITQLKGHIRLSVPVAFGRLVLTPLLPKFFAHYPNISIEIMASDRHVDLIGEGIDLAIRAKQLEDSALIARHLMDNELKLYASPDYIQRMGKPIKPSDLNTHACLLYSRFSEQQRWVLQDNNGTHSVDINGPLRSDNGDVLLEAALAGVGIGLFPFWMVSDWINQGKLTPVLPQYKERTLPMYVIYPKAINTPLRVRCFY
ncbi:LysR family transcriptional regulator [Enterovibrio nigricans]|nr:LysR family transcriptional regulator [Enterovibrio nigricans]PKF48906.1 LysR family transcriptional regulator [Enterovibrio nigricans]